MLSLVIPLYNEDESLQELYTWIAKVCDENTLIFELLFINDGSTDTSVDVIENIASLDSRVKLISFKRNYGKSAALQVGFEACIYPVVITMDADLQDSPDEIPALYRMIAEQRLDLVSGWKKDRHDPLMKTIPSKFFNLVTQKVSGIRLHDFNCGLKAYNARVVKNIVVYGEMHRYIPLIAKWNGFTKISEKVVVHRPRKYGVTKFGLERFVFGFLDLMSLVFVSKYKKRPMHFFGSLGTAFMMLGLAIAVYLSVDKFINSTFFHVRVREVTAQPLFYLALTGVVVGSQMFLAGFIGEMISQNNIRKNDYQIDKTINM